MATPYCFRRSQTYYLRIRTPADLSPWLGKFVVRTLRTKESGAAKSKAAHYVAKLSRVWDELRMKVLGKELADFSLSDMTRENVPRLEADLSRLTSEEQHKFRDHMDDLLNALEADNRETRLAMDMERDRLAVFHKGREKGLQEGMDRVGTHQAQHAPIPIPAMVDERKALTVVQLGPEFFASREYAPKTLEVNRFAFQEFDNLIGNKAIQRVTTSDVAAYKTFLIGKTGRRGREQASQASVEKSLNCVRRLIKWAYLEAGILDSDVGSKVRPPKESKKSKAEPKRLPFSDDTLTQIFTSPFFVGMESPRNMQIIGYYKAPAPKRLFMLAMLLTGARTEELPGSTLYDLDGIPCLSFITTGTKTAAARRIVPILPELRKLGFLTWAKEIDGPLFQCEQSAKKWSNFTVNYLNGLGVTDILHTPYSFRHNFRVMLRESNLNTEIANRIFGHESGDTAEMYGKIGLTRKEAEAFLKSVKAPIPLNHLYPQ